MNTVERELIERIHHLDEEKQRQVLEFVQTIETPTEQKRYSARELMKLPFAERNRILLEQLERAANEDFETFEAYSEEEIDESS
jgi:hypothetical protein